MVDVDNIVAREKEYPVLFFVGILEDMDPKALWDRFKIQLGMELAAFRAFEAGYRAFGDTLPGEYTEALAVCPGLHQIWRKH
jgi:hypothetical protein